jgi:hypothetical protein
LQSDIDKKDIERTVARATVRRAHSRESRFAVAAIRINNSERSRTAQEQFLSIRTRRKRDRDPHLSVVGGAAIC